MSRIEAGGLKVNRDLVSIADVVQGAVERSRKAFPGEPVRVSLAPNLPFVRGDDKLLEQVLFNLLDNAHKYAGDAGAIVHARQEGDEVVLSVTDEGPGIKPAELERIFEKFYRGGRPTGARRARGLAFRSRGGWSKPWEGQSWRRARRCAGEARDLSCAFPSPRRAPIALSPAV